MRYAPVLACPRTKSGLVPRSGSGENSRSHRGVACIGPFLTKFKVSSKACRPRSSGKLLQRPKFSRMPHPRAFCNGGCFVRSPLVTCEPLLHHMRSERDRTITVLIRISFRYRVCYRGPILCALKLATDEGHGQVARTSAALQLCEQRAARIPTRNTLRIEIAATPSKSMRCKFLPAT